MRLLPFAKARAWPILLAFLSVSFSAQLRAQTDGQSFYLGQTITIVCSQSAGGIYDSTARAVARHMPRHIPGKPAMVVRNMVGAGGLVGANYLYSAASKDGLTIGAVNNIMPFEPLYGTKEANFDPTKFTWLGSPGYETGMLIVWHESKITDVAQAKVNEVRLGSSGVFSTPSFYARLMNITLGTKLKSVVGYAGQNSVFFAMERGEIDGHASTYYSAMSAIKPDWISGRKARVLLQYGPQKEPELPGVPSVADLVSNPQDRLLWDAATASLAVGRPFLIPPDVPADRVAILRKAFDATLRDPEFLAEAERLKLGVNKPSTGEQLREIIDQAYAMPGDIISRLRNIAKERDS